MKEMNSDTHSCRHSLDSLAIFAEAGRQSFMIRDTFAILDKNEGELSFSFLLLSLLLFLLHPSRSKTRKTHW